MTLEQENAILKEHLVAMYLNVCWLTQSPDEEVVDPDGLKDRGTIKYGNIEVIDYFGKNHSEPAAFDYCYNNFLKQEIEK